MKPKTELTPKTGPTPIPPDEKFPSVHKPSVLFVTGRSYVPHWPPSKRRKLRDFIELANSFGFHVHEADPPMGGRTRTRWSSARVPLGHALAVLHDHPDGMLFDEWSKLWERGGQTDELAIKAARAKATVALSKLNALGKVGKEYGLDGRLSLRPLGSMDYTL